MLQKGHLAALVADSNNFMFFFFCTFVGSKLLIQVVHLLCSSNKPQDIWYYILYFYKSLDIKKKRLKNLKV